MTDQSDAAVSTLVHERFKRILTAKGVLPEAIGDMRERLQGKHVDDSADDDTIIAAVDGIRGAGEAPHLFGGPKVTTAANLDHPGMKSINKPAAALSSEEIDQIGSGKAYVGGRYGEPV